MITRKEAEARIAAGGTLSRSELSHLSSSPGDMMAGEWNKFVRACPELVAEQEQRYAAAQADWIRYLEEEAPLRDDLHRLGYPVESVWDFVNAKENDYLNAIPTLIDHLQRPYGDKVREGIARSLAIKEARGVAGSAIIKVLGEEGLSHDLRWALANTLTTVADRSDHNSIQALLATESNKEVADRLNRALKTAAKP